MKNQWSFWEQQTFLRKADLIIIGAGIVGINAAISLKESEPKKHIIVLERGSLPMGASTRNAGFACFGSMTELIADLQDQEQDEVFALVERRWRGLLRLRARIGEQQMDYHTHGAFELFRAPDRVAFAACEDKIADFNKLLSGITGEPEVFKRASDQIADFGFFGVEHLIANQLEGQLHPGKMMQALWRYARSIGIEILTGVEVSNLEQEDKGVNVIATNGILLQGKKVLLATNGFTRRLYPRLAVLPARNQVLITKPIAKLPFQGCFHYEQGYFYFRNVGNRILLGGGRHLAKEEEQTDHFGQTTVIQDALKTLMSETILPNTPFEVEHWWSGILGVGAQKKPIIEAIEENIYVAVRLGGMGVAIGSLVGEEAAKMINYT